jgi:hypothetical protein
VYPFVLSSPVIAKLHFVYEVIVAKSAPVAKISR